ncbi:peptidylprolyl isomerase [Yoonia sp.]|uniref:peptidylprolyl isomerase n=1 Tax=Yoonia sp. TaxID=2212373 RepID=UPI002FDA15C4
MADKKKPRLGAWIIVGVILLGLAGFGAGGLSGTVRTIGTVGDKDVSVQTYQRVLNDQIRAVSAQFGQQITFQQAQAFGIDQMALGQVILLRTLDNEASNLGISVGDENVLERLRAIPQFQGAGGFNRETYRLALQQSGQTAVEFENDLREETARTLLQGAVVSGVPNQMAFADTLVQYTSENRAITWAVVDAGDLTAPVPGATEADQQAYYDANPQTFTAPETREITYAWLTPGMIQDQLDVPEAAIAQLYQDRIAEFVLPERRLVERLVYIAQDRAEEAAARLAAGEVSFEELVAERGLSLADVDMGDLAQDELGAAGEAVFAAAPGEVVGPIRTAFGPALFRMNAVLTSQETTLDEAREELRDELAADAARTFINDSSDAIIDLLAGGATMADLASRTDMELGTISWNADIVEGIAAYDDFRAAAANAEIGAFPTLLDLSDGGIFALTLDSITPPTLRPIDAVREELAAAVVARNTRDAVMAQAEELAGQVLPLTNFDTLGLTATIEEGVTRRTFIEGTPPDFNDTLFDMAVGDVRVLAADDRAIILRLDDISAPDLNDPSVIAQRDALSDTAAAGIAQDIFDAYASTLQVQTRIDINQQTINAINAQFQ